MKTTWYHWTAEKLGLSGLALNASNNQTTPIPTNNVSVLHFHFRHSNDSGALAIQGDLQYRLAGETSWSAVPFKFNVEGSQLLSTLPTVKVVAADEGWVWIIPDVPADEVRLANITAAGAAATDLLSISARSGVVS